MFFIKSQWVGVRDLQATEKMILVLIESCFQFNKKQQRVLDFSSQIHTFFVLFRLKIYLEWNVNNDRWLTAFLWIKLIDLYNFHRFEFIVLYKSRYFIFPSNRERERKKAEKLSIKYYKLFSLTQEQCNRYARTHITHTKKKCSLCVAKNDDLLFCSAFLCCFLLVF